MTKIKPLVIGLSVLFFSFPSFSQTPVLTSVLHSEMNSIISDYPNHFKNLTGDLLEEGTQVSSFTSKICLSGAAQCRVLKYSASGKEVYSWEAGFPAKEEFADVKKQFRNLYNQLQNLNLTWQNKTYTLSAPYAAPSEDLRFHSIVFTTGKQDEAAGKLKVELLLEADMLEWSIRILVYEKEREDEEKGPIFERNQ
jgi:hypothetical protein